MDIKLVRIDDRLIHGQVAVGWTRAVNASHIIVADDDVASNDTQIMLLKMAAPVGVKASILTINDAITKLKENHFKRDRLMIILKEPKSLIRLVEGGIEVDEVNVGNVSIKEGRKRIVKEIAATPDEINDWKRLDELGISLKLLWLPGGRAKNFNDIIRKH